MRTEVYINDQLIDLDEESTVAATYGNITFGEMNKRKGVKSNTWTAPFSQRNKLVMESCEISSSVSSIPYRNNDIRVEIDGTIVFEGFCVIDEANESYEIQSFSGPSDFYSFITNRKLNQLNLSAYTHTWGEVSIKNSWTAVDGYIYAFVNYSKDSSFDASGYPPTYLISPDYVLPQIFFSTVIKSIAADAGYTLTGDVLSDDRFLKHVIIANKFPLTITYGNTVDLTQVLPDVTQGKVWLDFANIYGLQFDIDDEANEIRCIFIDDLLFNEPQDWTQKVDRTDKKKVKYRIDSYGQISRLSFKSDADTDPNGCTEGYEKDVVIDDQTLDPEADIYKSDFYLIQNRYYPNSDSPAFTRTFNQKNGSSFYGVWDPAKNYFFLDYSTSYVWRNGTYYQLLQDSTNNDPVGSTGYWGPKLEKDIWDTKSRPMYGSLKVDISSPMMVAFPTPVSINRVIFASDLDWPTTYSRHYRVFNRIINKTKAVEQLIKLNYADINQVSFDTLKEIDGEQYILEEITQFKLNQPDSTICKFIRL